MADLCINGKMPLVYHSKCCKKTNIGSSQYAVWPFYTQKDLIRLVDDNPFLKCLNNFYLEILALKKLLTNISPFPWFPLECRKPCASLCWDFIFLIHCEVTYLLFQLFLLYIYSIFFSNLQLQESNWVLVIVQIFACKTGPGDWIMPCGQPHWLYTGP